MLMNILRKLYGGLNMTWPKTIIFAIVAGVYTGIVCLIPALQETSFKDIAVTMEMWVLLALVVVLNCAKPLEAVLKCFAFFVISQPLVYLVQAPFAGFHLLNYYQNWIIPTLLTIPAAFIAWQIKRDDWISGISLGLGCIVVGGMAASYAMRMVVWHSFPYHILTVLVCLAAIVLLPLCLLSSVRDRLICWAITLVLVVAFGVQEYRAVTKVDTSNGYEVGSATSCDISDDPDGIVDSLELDTDVEAVLLHATGYGSATMTCAMKDGSTDTYRITVQKDYQSQYAKIVFTKQ